jgi:hypothetical protein
VPATEHQEDRNSWEIDEVEGADEATARPLEELSSADDGSAEARAAAASSSRVRFVSSKDICSLAAAQAMVARERGIIMGSRGSVWA